MAVLIILVEENPDKGSSPNVIPEVVEVQGKQYRKI
jgi:hypothetical protein